MYSYIFFTDQTRNVTYFRNERLVVFLLVVYVYQVSFFICLVMKTYIYIYIYILYRK